MGFSLFKKKRNVDFILSPNPEENSSVEKTDEDIKKISLDKIALGPAATEQDIQNYSQNQNLNSLDYFGESSQKETQIQETQENSFFPFMQQDSTEKIPDQYTPFDKSIDPDIIIKLQRKIDNLVDEIEFLKKKIERLEN